MKHRALPLVGRRPRGPRASWARELGGWRARRRLGRRGRAAEAAAYRAFVAGRTAPAARGRPTRRWSAPSTGSRARTTTSLAAAGGFPGELNVNWLAPPASARSTASTASRAWATSSPGAWGARLARPARRRDRVRRRRLVPDAQLRPLLRRAARRSKLIVVVCDNGGYAVIDRLQTGQGGASFNNMLGRRRERARSTSPRTPGRSAATPRRWHDRRARGGVRAARGAPTARR